MPETSTSPALPIPSIPCWEILRRAWGISFTHALALVLAKFVVDIPYSIISTGIQDPMISFRFSSFYEALVGGFVTLGIYRCILLLESEGTAPTFSNVYAQGIRYYSRNFRMNVLFGCYFLLIALGCFVLLSPGLWLNEQSPDYPSPPWFLMAGGLASTVLVSWWLLRTLFHNALLCDGAKGAVDAMDKTLALTKRNTLTLLPIGLILSIMFSFVVSVSTFTRGLIFDHYSDLTLASARLVDLAFLLPYTFMEVFVAATMVLVYLHFRKYAHAQPVAVITT
jgi:hypothetical protein